MMTYDLREKATPQPKPKRRMLLYDKPYVSLTKQRRKIKRKISAASRHQRDPLKKRLEKINKEIIKLGNKLMKNRRKRKLQQIKDDFQSEKLSWRGVTNALPIKPFKDLEPTEARLPNGELAKGGPVFKKIYRDFFEIICSKPPSTPDDDEREEEFLGFVRENWDVDVDPLFDAKFERFEINELIKTLPFKKSPGPLGLSYEFLKMLWDVAPDETTDTFNKILDEGYMPQKWCEGTLMLLHKGDDAADPNNYRPIALLNTFWKLLMKLINNRIVMFLERNKLLKSHQKGFRKKRNCQQHIAAVQEILSNRKSNGHNRTFMTFYDLTKAYDTVWHEALWFKMTRIGIKGKVLKLIINAYSKTTNRIRTKHGFTSSFRVTRGVRQGCPLSPTLFNIYINDILDDVPNELGVRTFAEPGRSYNDPFKKRIHKQLGFLFADDLLTLAATHWHAQKVCYKIQEWCVKWHMKLGTKKCKMIPVGVTKWETADKTPLWLDHSRTECIEQVQSYKYLGVLQL